MEITLNGGQIIATCTELIDSKNIKCKVLAGGCLEARSYVCIRGLKHSKKILDAKDKTLIEFAMEFSVCTNLLHLLISLTVEIGAW